MNTAIIEHKIDKPKEQKEYVAGIHRDIGNYIYPPTPFDAAVKVQGDKIYDSMMTDAVVRGSVDILRYGIISTGLTLTPRIVKSPEKKKSPAGEKKSRIITKDIQKILEDMETPLREVLFDILSCMYLGCTMAEKVYERVNSKVVITKIKVKPRTNWSFVLEDTSEVSGFVVVEAGTNNRINVSKEKFFWLTWLQKESDPRGTSCLRSAYDPWILKTNLWPELYKSLQQFGSPSIVGTTSEDSAPIPERKEDGTLTGKIISPELALSNELNKFANGKSITVPYGTTVQMHYPVGTGEAFFRSLDVFNREITHSIMNNTRNTLEARFGSKADSEIGENVTGLPVRHGRDLLASAIRNRIIKRQVEILYGREESINNSPVVSLGQTDHQDFPSTAQAVAALTRSGYLTEGQLSSLDSWMGIKVREPGEKPMEKKSSRGERDEKIPV